MNKPRLYLISGPSGSGKTTLCDRALATFPEHFSRVVTATTRAPRGGEQEGVDYFFLTPAEFELGIQEDRFYEWAKVHQNYYGVLKSEIRGKLDAGHNVLLNIDVQGAETIRKAAHNDPLLRGKVTSIFIRLPDETTLIERIEQRGKMDAPEIKKRIESMHAENKAIESFDYCIPTSSRDEDFEALCSIIQAQDFRT